MCSNGEKVYAGDIIIIMYIYTLQIPIVTYIRDKKGKKKKKVLQNIMRFYLMREVEKLLFL